MSDNDDRRIKVEYFQIKGFKLENDRVRVAFGPFDLLLSPKAAAKLKLGEWYAIELTKLRTGEEQTRK